MAKYYNLKKINSKDEDECYLFTWSIPNVTSNESFSKSIDNIKGTHNETYQAILSADTSQVSFTLISSVRLKCSLSMFIGSESLLLSKKLRIEKKSNSSFYQFCFIISSDDECFQKLKRRDTLVIICRIKSALPFWCASPALKSDKFSTNGASNLKKLATTFKNSPESLLKQKVLLKVGQETETVSKLVLCSRSPVFAKMFESGMRELNENVVIIKDIKMPVLRVLVSFLYTGKLPNYEFDFLCDLFYASDKYDISELRQICVDLLLPEISMENVFRVLKMALCHNVESLKVTALIFIAENIEILVSTQDWRNLIDNEPKSAVEISKFLNF